MRDKSQEPEWDIVIYRMEEPNKPDYIPVSDFPVRIDEMKVGDYAETVDGYIVPMIYNGYWRDTEKGMRNRTRQRVVKFASTVLVTIPVTRIRRGLYYVVYNNAHRYFHPTNQHRHTKLLTAQEAEFCWRVAQTFNPHQAARDIFDIKYISVANIIGSLLLKKKRYNRAL